MLRSNAWFTVQAPSWWWKQLHFPFHSSNSQKKKDFFDKKLSEYKEEKLKRKLPVHAQLLDCNQEDIKIKRCLLDEMDKQYADSIAGIPKNMEKLSESINEGFRFLKMMYNTHPLCMVHLSNTTTCMVPYRTSLVLAVL